MSTKSIQRKINGIPHVVQVFNERRLSTTVLERGHVRHNTETKQNRLQNTKIVPTNCTVKLSRQSNRKDLCRKTLILYENKKPTVQRTDGRTETTICH